MAGFEPLEGAGVDHLLAEAVVLFVAAVAPVDGLGLAQRGHVGHPGDQLGVLDIGGRLHGEALQRCVHRMSPKLKIVFSNGTRRLRGRRDPLEKTFPSGDGESMPAPQGSGRRAAARWRASCARVAAGVRPCRRQWTPAAASARRQRAAAPAASGGRSTRPRLFRRAAAWSGSTGVGLDIRVPWVLGLGRFYRLGRGPRSRGLPRPFSGPADDRSSHSPQSVAHHVLLDFAAAFGQPL